MDESASLSQESISAVTDQRVGSYRIVHPLGAGGMSSVFRAVHVESGNEVALKVLTRTLARNSTLLQRFLREARSAETLQHPNIVTIYDRGIDRGRHYLVLEYVAGGDFHEYIRDHGPLDAAEAISVVKSVAAGLNYASTRGLIHRDIKPSNILRTPEGLIKIIDLGLALQNEFEDERVTREGTTVGTVDYMAPEQARDSRATSIQSDIYSLGCTLYYFLAGVPPFPGGDITDKLTRHAKSPAPDVRELRQDLPAGIGAIIEKMMAKKPEDRFRSYADLIAALDDVASRGLEEGRGIALVPLDSETHDQPPSAAHEPWPSVASGEYATIASDSGHQREFTLAEIASELEVEPSRPSTARFPTVAPPAPIPRQALDEDEETLADEVVFHEIPSPSRSSGTAGVWIISGAFVGVAVILLVIGLIQLMDSSPVVTEDAPIASSLDVVSDRPIAAASRADLAALTKRRGLSSNDRTVHAVKKQPAAPVAEPAWQEPIDTEAVDTGSGKVAAFTQAEARFLPDWARTPVPDGIGAPFVVVRRTFTGGDPFKLTALGLALDRHIGGTIELADEGPLYVDDLRVAGDSRLIRARPGYRPIVRVEGSNVEAVRSQGAVFVLDGKNLTLDGIDLVVDVNDLPSEQTALFSCSSAASLTVRNCSITILNNRRAVSFAVVRAGAGTSHPSRIRFERTLVRGLFSPAFELAGGAELVLNHSVVLGGPGPLIRFADGSSVQEQRLFLLASILVGPGPIIRRETRDPGPEAKPLLIRASGTVFGRFHGVGVSSVISSATATAPAAKQVDWVGDNNLFAGWKGFFACGNDATVTITDLAEIRSTWNGADQNSHEILASWHNPYDLAATTPVELEPFVPGREAILRQVAQPRSGLFQKAIGEYTTPTIPQPIGWTRAGLDVSRKATTGPVMRPFVVEGQISGGAPVRSVPTFAVTPSSAVVELPFSTESLPWAGDLGAFLRDRLTPGMSNVRVIVVGSGPHRFTPVRLPAGLWLEIRVEPMASAEPPSWSPQPNSTGPALIEVRGGSLILSNFVLRNEESARLDHLIHVEDAHLVLSRCQLISQGPPSDFPGDLIAFTAVSTRPFPIEPNRVLFSVPVDRAICRLDESILITGGTALKADIGRGLISLTQCAVAAGTSAVELLPSRVSRQRFEADLVMDRCTMTSEHSVIRLGPWPGLAPGPDRPWLITSQNCAFLAVYDRKARETVLLRADADALARGTVSWQATDDAVDVDFFVAAADLPLPPLRSRDLQVQWMHFWGWSHMNGRMTGPRGSGSGNLPSVRLWDKLHPGRIEPVDLILNPDYHPDRELLNVGADLGWLGSRPRTARSLRVRS